MVLQEKDKYVKTNLKIPPELHSRLEIEKAKRKLSAGKITLHDLIIDILNKTVPQLPQPVEEQVYG